MARKIQQAYSLEAQDLDRLENIRKAQAEWHNGATSSSAVRLAIRMCNNLIKFGKFQEVRFMIRQLKVDAGMSLEDD